MNIDDLPPDVATVEIDALENLRIDDLIRVLGVAGHDVVAYARLRMLDFTDAEIAAQLGWSLRDVGAVRKRLSRIGPRIARLIEPN